MWAVAGGSGSTTTGALEAVLRIPLFRARADSSDVRRSRGLKGTRATLAVGMRGRRPTK